VTPFLLCVIGKSNWLRKVKKSRKLGKGSSCSRNVEIMWLSAERHPRVSFHPWHAGPPASRPHAEQLLDLMHFGSHTFKAECYLRRKQPPLLPATKIKRTFFFLLSYRPQNWLQPVPTSYLPSEWACWKSVTIYPTRVVIFCPVSVYSPAY
jgi:hypothetical protein